MLYLKLIIWPSADAFLDIVLGKVKRWPKKKNSCPRQKQNSDRQRLGNIAKGQVNRFYEPW